MSKLRVGITTSSFSDGNSEPLNALGTYGVEVVTNPYRRRLSQDEIYDYISDKDGLIAGLEPLNERVLKNATQLKAIARVGIGMTNVDVDCANRLGIKVSNTPDGPTMAVAELTLSAALSIIRNLFESNTSLHSGNWEKRLGQGMSSQKVLFVGYGRIGRKTAEYMRMLGAQILVHDPLVEADQLEYGEQWVEMANGLGEADIITLHASGTQAIIGQEQFEQMKEGAILLNSARGELVDEDSLVQAIELGKVGGVWFDAFWQEPYNGRLLKFDNVLLTPHVGTYTKQCRLSMEMDAVENLVRDLGVV